MNIFSGIYEIVNKNNGKRYVGSAINIHTRWNDHRKRLRKDAHHSARLQNAWNKHGEAAFSFSVLRKVENKKDLILVEQEFIDKLRPEYNICKIAGNTMGRSPTERTRQAVAEQNRKRVHSDETRRKLATNTGKCFSDEHREKISLWRKQFYSNGGKNGNERAVDQLSVDGIFIARFESVAEAARLLNMPATHISRCARGKRKTSRGYQWRYADSHATNLIWRRRGQ